MPFSSFNFLLALPLMVVGFWTLPPKYQKGWLLVLSGIVYLAAGWMDLLLLVAVVAINWCGPVLLGASRNLARSLIVLDLGVLGWFKYRAFLASLAGWSHPMSIVIPLGISFYIFQLIAYQVELVRGELERRPGFLDFFLYIFFFPHHQAGPIMRPHAFLINFSRPRTFFRSRLLTGVIIFAWGLFKKVWIADVVAPLVDAQFLRFHERSGMVGNLWLLGVLYGIQIYGDFSGYSDMAVGLGRMFGFKFDRNFHQPYLAAGASEFWRRWHVTLSQWLRDYVYIPLGGGRISPARTLVNLLLVMLVGGLWHGASWNFVLWGGLHGVLLVLGRLLPERMAGRARLPRILMFQALVMLTWVFFREVDTSAILNAASRLSGWWGPGTFQAGILFAGMLLFSRMEQWLERRFAGLVSRLGQWPLPAFSVAYGCVLAFILIGAGSATTFIYQRF